MREQCWELLTQFPILQLLFLLFSSPSPLSRQRPASPATPKGRTASPSPAASPKPPSTRGSPSTPKARPKRARTPARIDHRTSSPAPLERVRQPHRPATPEEKKSEYKKERPSDWTIINFKSIQSNQAVSEMRLILNCPKWVWMVVSVSLC